MADPFWSDVTLLLHFAGTDGSTDINDESALGNAITAVGDARIGSNQLVLDGNQNEAHYITLPNSSALLDPTQPLCIEAILTTDDNYFGLWYLFSTDDASNNNGLNFGTFQSRPSSWGYDAAGDPGFEMYASAGTLPQDTEFHMALSRDGSGNWRQFVDGTIQDVLVAEDTNTTGTTEPLAIIGGNNNGGYSASATIRAFRVTSGSSRYTANFTPPTDFLSDLTQARGAVPSPLSAPEILAFAPDTVVIAAPTPLGIPSPEVFAQYIDPYITDVSLLMHGNGVDGSTEILDSSETFHTVTVTGDTQIDTAQSKFGGASIYFDGAGDYLNITDNANKDDFAFPGNLAFTVEFWVRFEGTAADQYCITFGPSTFAYNISIYTNSSSRMVTYLRGSRMTGPVMAIDTWHHVAISRNTSEAMYMYINGVRTSGSYSLAVNQISYDNYPYIGANNDGTDPLSGWLDDIRVTKGVNRYPNNFVPPTAQHPDLPSTVRASAVTPLGVPVIELANGRSMWAIVPSPLGDQDILVNYLDQVRVVMPSPLGPPVIDFYNDFSSIVFGIPANYVMRLTSAPTVQVPISSWQSTIQSDRQNYLQCIVPNADAWYAEIAASVDTDDMVVYRTVLVNGQTIESEMARVPLSTVVINRGGFRQTATLSGYAAATTSAQAVPPIELIEVQTITQTIGGNIRVRCAINWDLKPTQSAVADGNTFTVTFINYYITSDGQAYMDCGSR